MLPLIISKIETSFSCPLHSFALFLLQKVLDSKERKTPLTNVCFSGFLEVLCKHPNDHETQEIRVFEESRE
jgi:hypothetical protein